MDFGLLKRDPSKLAMNTFDTGGRLSLTGELRGTPAYMAPEQIDPKSFGGQGPLTDVYALGGLLHFLLTGKPPLEGTSIINVLHQVVKEAPPDPRTLNAAAPRALVELSQQALAKQPSARPPSALAFAAALEAFLSRKKKALLLAPLASLPSAKEPQPKASRKVQDLVLWLALLLGFLAICLLAGDPGAAARDQARRHITRGVQLSNGGEEAAAISEFVLALDLLPARDPLSEEAARLAEEAKDQRRRRERMHHQVETLARGLSLLRQDRWQDAYLARPRATRRSSSRSERSTA